MGSFRFRFVVSEIIGKIKEKKTQKGGLSQKNFGLLNSDLKSGNANRQHIFF